MRDLIVKMSMSIDGFVASPEGGSRWMLTGDEEAKAWSVETVWNAGLHIMGSRTFRDMAAYWPTSTDVFAPPMNQIPKAVFSSQGPAVLATVPTRSDPAAELQPGAESWAQAYVASGDLAEEIVRLKAQEGKPIIAHGGASFVRSLVAHGLVDQFSLMVIPIALGKGLPVFSDLAAPRSLKLMSSKAFPKGAVAQIYRLS
jgi:dihydrofolate reductase